jgi:SAM-dependent methyltransferase
VNRPPEGPRSSPEFWSRIAEQYERDHYRHVRVYPALRIRLRYILDMLGAGARRVLDVGCGPGELLGELLDRGCTVSGADSSEGMLELARKKTDSHPRRTSLDLAFGDVESLGYASGTFDAVICAGVIEYLGTDAIALAEISRILAPGGVLIVSVRNKACAARAWDLIGDAAKRTRAGLALMTAVKRALTGDPGTTVVYTPYRKHTPWGLDRGLHSAGFEKVDFRYFHFYPFFAPLERLLPGLFIRAGVTLERFNHSAFSWLIAAGYIVKARKCEPLGRAAHEGHR